MAYQTTAATTKPPPAAIPPPQVQRYSIKVPKNIKKRYNIMKFNAGLKVDFKDWNHVKMERENNTKSFGGVEDDMPKFGAGSEFGRAAREEARRKKYGINSRKYKLEDQPWILKTNGKNGKKFKGVKEGGVNENAAYYIFSQAPDGSIEAYPLHEWYKFQLVHRYKTLSAEEAEEEFLRRDKVLNYFSVMMRKRLRNEDEETDEAELADKKVGKKTNKKDKDLKISEMDEWIDSDDDSDSDDKENQKDSDDEEDTKKKKKNGKVAQKKKKKNVSDDEAFEESDDGDEEGRERDYISDSSASESELEEQKQIKSVAEERGLRQLLDSDDSDEDEENKDKKSDEEEGKEKDDKEKGKSEKTETKEKGKKKDKKKDKQKDKQKDSSASSSDLESGLQAPTAGPSGKRSQNESFDTPQAKKTKFDNNYPSSSYIPGSSETGITEDAVRRYLMRKPMTATELLQKFKSKKTGLSSEKIATIMTKILKRLNPTSQKIKGKTYFSIDKPHN